MIDRIRIAAGATAHFVRARWRWHTLKADTLARYQDRHAQAAVRYAATYSPYYQGHWQGRDLDDWRALPTVDKSAMMANFDTFNTLGIGYMEAVAVAQRAEQTRDFAPRLHGVTVGLSSGTSGQRGLFLVSPQEQAAWAGMILARALHTVRGRLRVAFFLRAHSNLYAQASGVLVNLRYFDLATPLAEVHASLNTYQPHIVVGPPSLLATLAQAAQAGDLHVRPQRLIAVAEVLEPQDKDHLERTFAAPVHQIYQCTEGLLAISCPHGSVHLQEDIVAVQCELLPADGSGVARVTPIVTDLWRRTQPIIRYRLDDILQLSPTPCACGSPFRVIERIEGRLTDACRLLTPTGEVRPLYPDTLRRIVLGSASAAAQIDDYLVQQQGAGKMIVYLQVRPTASFPIAAAALRAALTQWATTQGCAAPTLTVLAGTPARHAWIKRRRVQQVGSAEAAL